MAQRRVAIVALVLGVMLAAGGAHADPRAESRALAVQSTGTAIVAPHGAKYTNPRQALADVANWCPTSWPTNCQLVILSGTYDLGATTLDLPPNVDLRGADAGATVLLSTANPALAVHYLRPVTIEALAITVTGDDLVGVRLDAWTDLRLHDVHLLVSSQNAGALGISVGQDAGVLIDGGYVEALSSVFQAQVTAVASGQASSIGAKDAILIGAITGNEDSVAVIRSSIQGPVHFTGFLTMREATLMGPIQLSRVTGSITDSRLAWVEIADMGTGPLEISRTSIKAGPSFGIFALNIHDRSDPVLLRDATVLGPITVDGQAHLLCHEVLDDLLQPVACP